MKVVILCGGKGSRLASPTEHKPKPLAMVNGKPIIWHIMKIYMKYGLNDFILPLGFGGEKIKEYFWNYEWKNKNFIKDYSNNTIKFLDKPENWKITFVDTGVDTMTGGRVKKVQKYIDGDAFMMTYGDGLSDINIKNLIDYHYHKGKIATVTGVERKSQYGILTVENGIAKSFDEKSKLDGIINGGFFVLSTKVFDYIEDDAGCIFEQKPLKALAKQGELSVYLHRGYWASIDTYKDLISANKTWKI
ncbi:nucleotidyl transferase [Clostridium pasteurianum DSM 525 = ATCC 6013]|uniref:Glucose-1-phosphate cytidylyltransferase n=1 Tax=Clostridium pasteurianum DSM 525 = ATCC 6013 TaxID=1262449 RepID=A0A0H3J284_CLOPA|nr:sugar phosphate nucleotidyltransferase [Clostridium pasteurianum]AJA46877.1 nucleotidyl transferase [Clostridium pasteurianum DSM 525 = ATCC 6013]AJA50865.1 nucleotidyl transferase [Clostridium pasteurianum DSM 525 = ATCC 6013]AOZ74262.1 glucose-1-phosphate cytidylyltransferase [Clostridium pasteurianum DSM 525 = ATCC 6013]AOZ78061.1 glucose-1-phosphate cytidylyltransferase [Clostridium pasteurianum]ELP58126.1 glucose-1-phosphate cytidylyltransferase [Clostridium pasteurianum DSM 525 = ATCC